MCRLYPPVLGMLMLTALALWNVHRADVERDTATQAVDLLEKVAKQRDEWHAIANTCLSAENGNLLFANGMLANCVTIGDMVTCDWGELPVPQ